MRTPHHARPLPSDVSTAACDRQPTYVIVNNKAEGCAPLSIVQLARQIVEPESDAGARGTLNQSGSR